jgi:hypothetical protein
MQRGANAGQLPLREPATTRLDRRKPRPWTRAVIGSRVPDEGQPRTGSTSSPAAIPGAALRAIGVRAAPGAPIQVHMVAPQRAWLDDLDHTTAVAAASRPRCPAPFARHGIPEHQGVDRLIMAPANHNTDSARPPTRSALCTLARSHRNPS